MKKKIQLSLLLFVSTAFASSLLAQDVQKEMLSLTKKYEQAYNKKDYKTLQAMYTKDATRTEADGKVENGNETIATVLADQLKDAETATLTITPDQAETAADGTVTATGSFHVQGKAKQSGEAFDVKGTYTNTLVKENGKWKIAKSVLSAM